SSSRTTSFRFRCITTSAASHGRGRSTGRGHSKTRSIRWRAGTSTSGKCPDLAFPLACMTEPTLTGPDPFAYRAVWGMPVKSRHAFDLIVARQLLWMAHAHPLVRGMLFDAEGHPVCPVCGGLVATGPP